MRPLGNKKAVNPGRWEQDLVRTMKKHQIIHLNLQMSTLICCWDFRGSEMEGSSGDGEGKRSCQKQQELCLSVLSAIDELLASEPMASSK